MRRPALGELLAAVAGVGLLVGLTLEWFQVSVEAERVRGAASLAQQAGGVTGWEAFAFIDVVLVLAAVAALALALARATGGMPLTDVHPGAVVAFLGLAAVAAAIVGITDPPAEEGTFPGGIVVEVGIEPGAWLSLAASAGVAAAGWLCWRDQL